MNSWMSKKHHFVVIALLLALSSLVQAVVIWRAAVPAVDAVRFARIAQAIDQHGFAPAVEKEREQPLFPLWTCAVHRVLSSTWGDAPSLWATSVQWAASLALVAAIVPLYFLVLRLLGPSAATAACLFFCVIPEVSCLGAEGISDSTHLFFFIVAFWAIVEWWQSDARTMKHAPSPWGGRQGHLAQESPKTNLADKQSVASSKAKDASWLVLSGAATGLAALARSEALILPVALFLAMALLQCSAASRQAWTRFALGGCGYVLGMSLIFGPYLFALGSSSPGAAMARLLGRAATVEMPSAELPSDSPIWQFDDGSAMAFPVKEPDRSIRRRGYWAATLQYGEELVRAFGVGVSLLALLGLWALWRMPSRPVDRFIQVFFLVFSAAVVVHASAEGYLSPRHLLPLVVAGIGCAGVGALELGRWLAAFVAKVNPPRPFALSPLSATIVVVVAVLGVSLTRTLRPLHANRAGYREAGEWLATQAKTTDVVLDTLGWTSLYSGLPTLQYDEAKAAYCHPRLAYVVARQEEIESSSDRGRTLRHLLASAGKPARQFPCSPNDKKSRSIVVVHSWNPQQFRHLVSQRIGESRGADAP